MPRPVFDIEQYELRGIEPEVFTLDQRTDLRKALARTHGQIDWTAQLLGFNGPTYWGRANPKSDHTYNFVGLPETMDEKRQMQLGAFGVYHKDLSYDNWPAPFNRSDVKASADQKFHIFETDGHTVISPLGVGEGFDYMDSPSVINGGSYVFDCEIEVEILFGGDQSDADPSVVVTTDYEKGVGTRLTVKRNINGSLTVKKKGSEAKPLALEVLDWHDISDWTPTQVSRQFLGCWGNKGNQLSTDFLFDALSLHGNEEHHTLLQVPQIQSIAIEDLFALTGLDPTPWTSLYPEKFMFQVSGVETPFAPKFPVLGSGVGNPWFGDVHWPPTYVENREVMDEEVSDCNHWVKSWQRFEDYLYDNGEYPGLCPEEESPVFEDYDNETFADAPQADTVLFDQEYHNFDESVEEVQEGYYNRTPHPLAPNACDESWIWTAQGSTDNGTFEELYNAVEFRIEYDTVDEDIYDRLPYSGITGFEFTWEALTAGGILKDICVSWIFDAGLDGGTLEFGYHDVFPPPDPNGEKWLWAEGPWATANAGEYDTITKINCTTMVSETPERACNPDTFFCGFDDGEYDNWNAILTCEEQPTNPNSTEGCHNPGCEPEDNATVDCTADGGQISYSGMPDYDDCECAVECCEVENEVIPPLPPYTGPTVIDGSIFLSYCAPADPPPVIEYRDDLSLKWVKLEALSSKQLKFTPSVHNSFYPLRIWKNHTLQQTDTVPSKQGHHEYRNFLVADSNRGTEPEDSYRNFVRLPAEYNREGLEWNRSVQICENQQYFSSPPKLNEIDLVGKSPEPRVYETAYRQSVQPDKVHIYSEDFLYSDTNVDYSEAELGGFRSAVVSYEDPRPIPFRYGDITEYDHYSLRKTDASGEWVGSYYRIGPNPNLTGHLLTDVESQALIEVRPENDPVYDNSEMKRPNITFPEENPLVSEKNYVVGYAYFTSDLSASEEACFEPTLAHCWRNTQIDNEVEKNGECIYDPLVSNTSYLLHPTPTENGQRTRETRVPGEVSKTQGTYDLPSDGSSTGGTQSSGSSSGGGTSTSTSSGTGSYTSPSPSPSGGGY